ncbi:MAG: hypothetical protein WKF77_18870 [Planctomycetaceae bacterium]
MLRLQHKEERENVFTTDIADFTDEHTAIHPWHPRLKNWFYVK